MSYYWPAHTHYGKEYVVQPGDNDGYPVPDSAEWVSETAVFSKTAEAAALAGIVTATDDVDAVYLYSTTEEPARNWISCSDDYVCFEPVRYTNTVEVNLASPVPVSENLRTMVELTYRDGAGGTDKSVSKRIIPEFSGPLP